MKIIKTEIDDVLIIEPDVYRDERGFFTESWSQRAFERNGLYFDFIQDNHSFTAKKGTLRGMHFQKGKYAQAKLVRAASGKVLDVAVDIRKDSLTYKKYVSVVLSGENGRQLLVPRGFAHGFLTLTDNVHFLYRTDNYYNRESEGSILWCDRTLDIDWGIKEPFLSQKDKAALPFDERYEYFNYESMVNNE